MGLLTILSNVPVYASLPYKVIKYFPHFFDNYMVLGSVAECKVNECSVESLQHSRISKILVNTLCSLKCCNRPYLLVIPE